MAKKSVHSNSNKALVPAISFFRPARVSESCGVLVSVVMVVAAFLNLVVAASRTLLTNDLAVFLMQSSFCISFASEMVKLDSTEALFSKGNGQDKYLRSQ